MRAETEPSTRYLLFDFMRVESTEPRLEVGR